MPFTEDDKTLVKNMNQGYDQLAKGELPDNFVATGMPLTLKGASYFEANSLKENQDLIDKALKTGEGLENVPGYMSSASSSLASLHHISKLKHETDIEIEV